MLKKKKIKLLSAYLDNELNNVEKEFVRKKIQEDEEWAQEYNNLLTINSLPQKLIPLPDDPNFSDRVMQKLFMGQSKTYSFLPVPKYLIPAASLLILTAIIIVVVFIFQRKQVIEDFIVENANTVKDIYTSSLMKNDLYPVSSTLTNDDIFQFALYGVLPVNEEKDKVVQIGKSDKLGYFFEVGSSKPKNVIKKEINEIYSKLDLVDVQQQKIDSVLKDYKRNLETMVLVSPQNKLAVNANVWNINKALVHDIAKNMDRRQRENFYTYISYSRPDFEISEHTTLHFDSTIRKLKLMESGLKPFIVMSQDSVLLKDLVINYDSIETNFDRFKESGKPIQINCDSIIVSITTSKYYGHMDESYRKNIRIYKEKYNKTRDKWQTGIPIAVAIDTPFCRVEIPKVDRIINQSISITSKELKEYNKSLKYINFYKYIDKTTEKKLQKVQEIFEKKSKILSDSLIQIYKKSGELLKKFHGYNYQINPDSLNIPNIDVFLGNNHININRMIPKINIMPKIALDSLNNYLYNYNTSSYSRKQNKNRIMINVDSIIKKSLENIKIFKDEE
jgi:hypothetical protein